MCAVVYVCTHDDSTRKNLWLDGGATQNNAFFTDEIREIKKGTFLLNAGHGTAYQEKAPLFSQYTAAHSEVCSAECCDDGAVTHADMYGDMTAPMMHV